MFDQIAERLEKTFRTLRGFGKLTPANIEEATREIRLSLLEADVNYRVAKDLVERIAARALGAEVLRSVTPGQQFTKICYDELVRTLGAGDHALDLAARPPVVILLAGLQGSGKTTSAAKLARYLKEKMRKRVMLVSTDVHRPAAIEQLKKLGETVGVPVCDAAVGEDPIVIARRSLERARNEAADVLIVDSAGRTQIDEPMMQEIAAVKEVLQPREVLFVADAMTGQAAVDVSKEFHARLGLTGVILTKMDGDARGGAALSINAVTGAPVKFVGTGEKSDQFDLFHPERIASRIFGMGDILSLVEKAQEKVDAEKAERMQKKMLSGGFDLDDFLAQMKMVRSLGSLESTLGMIPGIGGALKQVKGKVDLEKELRKIEAIINSMTRAERANPDILNASRRRRIAQGSGTKVQDINQFMNQYLEMKKMMKRMQSMGLGALMKGIRGVR